MPRKGLSSDKKKSSIKEQVADAPSQVDKLCQNNSIPIYTLSTGKTGSTTRILLVPATIIRTHAAPVAVRSKRVYSSFFPAESTQDDAEIRDIKRRLSMPKVDYSNLNIYGDLSTAERAHQAVIQSLGEAIEAGDFEPPNNPEIPGLK